MAESGVSRGTSTRGRRSFRVQSAARRRRLSANPQAMPATVFMLQGRITMPWCRYPPLDRGDVRSKGSCTRVAREETWSGVRDVSISTILAARSVMTRSVSTPSCRAASSSRIPYTMPLAPESPTMMRFPAIAVRLAHLPGSIRGFGRRMSRHDALYANHPVPVFSYPGNAIEPGRYGTPGSRMAYRNEGLNEIRHESL